MKLKNKLVILILIIFIIFTTPIFSKATIEVTIKTAARSQSTMGSEFSTDSYLDEKTMNPIEDPNSFKPGSITNNDANKITKQINKIIGAIVTIGVIISVATLGILGIKYMIGSVEEKAEYKKSMIPYLIGAVLLFSSSVFVSIIAKLIKF